MLADAAGACQLDPAVQPSSVRLADPVTRCADGHGRQRLHRRHHVWQRAVSDGDLGFRGHVGSFNLASVKDLRTAATDDDVSYLALDIAGLNAGLVGLEDLLVFNAWGVDVLVNQVSAGTAVTPTPDKLDWANFAVSDGIALPTFNTALLDTVDLSISGGAELNVLSGLAVMKVASFDMTLGQLSGDDGATFLTDAQAMTVTLTDVDLWVGPGGALLNTANNDYTDASTFVDDAVDNGDLGFRGHVGSFNLASVKDLRTAATDDDVSRNSYSKLDFTNRPSRHLFQIRHPALDVILVLVRPSGLAPLRHLGSNRMHSASSRFIVVHVKRIAPQVV